ncbi:scm-like with four MBT domains protein 2 [Aphidius gifuensis]|uniref:scm-like with four MBT domains protein 2 n=1 Tax=Aphidius gifuensis TaxID=684658 RepID=UPI001CDC5528|nr:scm-like with four MBT domains protein 2 [Aphidius gifuensis]
MDNMMEDDEGPEFVWQDYLDATKTIEVPQINFHHVEATLQNGIEIGMSLEVPVVKENESDDICWVATIVMACGPLLRLRYYGGDDRSLEFWFNLTKEAAHELGWCKKNNKRLEPPQSIIDKSPDCIDTLDNFLTTATSVPSEMLSGEGLSMVDRIKDGTKVEVNDPQNPYNLWVATIMENVGGRLLLRYDTPGALVNDFWVFCTSETLHVHGFATKKINSKKYCLQPPSSVIDTHTYDEWKEIYDASPKDDVSSQNLFNYNTIHAHHKFKTGMKIEALLPNDRTKICPATIGKVFDEVYFLVEIDQIYSMNDKKSWLCTVDHPYIFPIDWSKKNGIKIEPPAGWNRLVNGEFEWKNYLKLTKSIAANEELFPQRESAIDGGFEVNMRLEAVDPRNEGTICAAHITKIVQDLLWISLDNDPIKCPQHIVHMRSMQIFPVGWCESNLFPLESPKDYATVCRKIDYDDKKIDKRSFVDMPMSSDQKISSWSPKIYFNYRCHTGPMVSKGKLATLPKSVGPGPATLVMKEILSMIVSVGYRSSRILKAIQCDTKAETGYELVELKAKYKDRTYRANVAVVSSGEMVPEFCRNICKKILVCPNLFGPIKVAELSKCPDRCQKAKHRFTLSASKKPTTVYNMNNNSLNNQDDDNDDDDDSEKSKPWGKKKRKNQDDDDDEEEDDNNDESAFIDMDKKKTNNHCNNDERPQLSEIDMMIHKNLTKTKNLLIKKTSVPSSNASDDSRSSFNDRRSKESNIDSPGSINTPKNSLNGSLSQSIKRERDFDDAGESEADDNEDEYVRIQQKQRRPKTRKLESNPLSWSVDDVFRYLRKTSDCKDLAYRVRQEEIDGLAFLLLNLPSLTEHMKLRTSLAMKLCRHVEQVKVTYFIRYINEKETTTTAAASTINQTI